VSPALVETRAAKAAGTAALSMGLSIGLQLVSVPVCLRFWGNETYGLWLALVALANLCRTLDFGFTAYVGNELNLLYHRDPLELRRRLASALWGAVVAAAIELLGAALIVGSGALASLLGVGEETAEQGRAAVVFVVLLLGLVGTAPYLGIVHKLMVPAGMLHQATWWFMGLQIAQSAALVTAAWLQASLIQAAVLFACAQAVLQIGSALYVARKLPEYFPWWRGPVWSIGMDDLLRSTAMVGASLLTQAGTNGVVMLVSSGLGAAAVPAFTTIRTLSSLWTTLTSVVTSPLLPDVVRYHALKDPRKLVAGVEAHWLIANGVVNLSVLSCLPFLDNLYAFWTGGRVALDPGLLCAMLLSVVLAAPGALLVTYLAGINDLRAYTVLSAVRGLVPLAAGLLLMPWLGLVGVGLGIALGELLGATVVAGIYFRRQLRRIGHAAPPRWPPITLGTSILALYLAWAGRDGFHLGPAYGLALAGVTASLVWAWQGLDADVRERVVRLLRRSA
jgi:O-antigen/teichoic acid export membrane protein